MKKRIVIILLGGLFVVLGGLGILWYLGGRSLNRNPSDAEIRAKLLQAADEQFKQQTATGNSTNSSLILHQAINKKGDLPIVVSDLRQVKPSGVYYELTDLNLADISGKSAIGEYGRQLAQVLSLYTKANRFNEMDLALAAYQQNSSLPLANITMMRNLYTTMTTRLAAMTIPRDAGTAHLALINGLVGLTELDIYMEHILEEPVVGLQAIQLYPERASELLKALVGLNNYFNQHGLVLGQ